MSDVLLGARWALAIVFVNAGLVKLRTQTVAGRNQAVANYGVLPYRAVPIAARTLPLVEIVVGALLATGIATSATSLFVAVLVTAFAALIVWHLSRGHSFDCGCGKAVSTPISWALVCRNMVLAGLAAAVTVGPSGALAIWPDSLDATHAGSSASSLIAIPLIVVLAAALLRLVTGSALRYYRLADIRGLLTGSSRGATQQ
jgi:uncharacterized membrane protein YphA (DoxX/SURF4 family)